MSVGPAWLAGGAETPGSWNPLPAAGSCLRCGWVSQGRRCGKGAGARLARFLFRGWGYGTMLPLEIPREALGALALPQGYWVPISNSLSSLLFVLVSRTRGSHQPEEAQAVPISVAHQQPAPGWPHGNKPLMAPSHPERGGGRGGPAEWSLLPGLGGQAAFHGRPDVPAVGASRFGFPGPCSPAGAWTPPFPPFFLKLSIAEQQGFRSLGRHLRQWLCPLHTHRPTPPARRPHEPQDLVVQGSWFHCCLGPLSLAPPLPVRTGPPGGGSRVWHRSPPHDRAQALDQEGPLTPLNLGP